MGKEIDRFAVNLNPVEGDLTSVDSEQLAVAVGGDGVRLIEYDEPLAEILAGFRVGRELWPIFLWAAAVLLAVEMLLGRKGSEE